MSQDPRHVPLKLHSAIGMATDLLDLPLTAAQRETLALELTGPVRALIAEALATAGDDSPVLYVVADAEQAVAGGEFEESEFAGRVTRVGLDVDLDTPAGTVAAKVRRQWDVTALEIRDAHTVAVTVRATSLMEWQWWLTQLHAVNAPVSFDGDTAIVTGSKDGAVVHLHGDDCRDFYTADLAAARLMGLIAEATL